MHAQSIVRAQAEATGRFRGGRWNFKFEGIAHDCDSACPYAASHLCLVEEGTRESYIKIICSACPEVTINQGQMHTAAAHQPVNIGHHGLPMYAGPQVTSGVTHRLG
jgi:hypothetical protein